MSSGVTRRGATLVELMVGSAAMLLLLASVATVFGASLQYFRRTEMLVELESRALLALKFISAELSESAENSVEIDPAVGMLFATMRNLDGQVELNAEGRPRWQGLVCYSVEDWNGSLSLLRRFEPMGPSGNPVIARNLEPPIEVSWFLTSGLPVRPLATRVERFQSVRISREVRTGSHFYELTLGLLGDPSPTGGENSIEIQTRVYPRN